MKEHQKPVNLAMHTRITFNADQMDTEALVAKLGFLIAQKPDDLDVFLITTKAGVLAGKWYASTEEGWLKPLTLNFNSK